MAIVYHLDLYPRINPVSGTLVRRLVNLQEAEYRGEANGTGSGKIVLRGTSADAAFIDPKGLQYIRVVRDDGATEKVVGGFFLEQGDFEALTERSTKKLTFGGAGTLSYLARGVVASTTYNPAAAVDQFPEPRDGAWHWYYSTIGSILWVMVNELQEPTRPQNPIPGLTMDFTFVAASPGGGSWPGYGDSLVLQAAVGISILEVAKMLMGQGLYISIDPDTFVLSAFMADTHGRDRTGSAWGSSVVRFQAPSAATVATGNIKSDAKRAVAALIKRSDLLMGSPTGIVPAGSTGYQWVNDPTADIVWEGSFYVDDPAGTSLATIGAVQLAARSDAGDTVRLRGKLGNSPTTGEYLPFEDVLLDDHVTLATGTGQWDWNETEQKIAAITLQLRQGGDWDAWYDLGSKYASIENRQFQVASGSGCACIQLCDPEFNWIETSTSWKALLGPTLPTGWNEIGFDDSAWDATVDGFAEPAGLPMIGRSTDKIRAQEVLFRREYVVDEASLTGADVVFKYAMDNGGIVYVNGVAVATLGTPYTAVAGNYTSDHATTIPRSAFVAGVNCVAIWGWNEDAGTNGSTPPGPLSVSAYIEMPTHNLGGTDPRAARCDHGHSAYQIIERNYGDVQSAIDALGASAAAGGSGGSEVLRPETVTLPARITGAAVLINDGQGQLTIDAGASYKAFPGQTVLDGIRYLVYRSGTDHGTTQDGDIYLRTKPVTGGAWSSATLLLTHASGHDLRDPSILALSSGRLVLGFDDDPGTSSGIIARVVYSDDRGLTWSAPYTIPDGFSGEAAGTSQMVELPNGTIIMPGFGDNGGDELCVAWISTDHGQTFPTEVPVASSGSRKYQELQLRLATNGELIGLMRSDTAVDTWLTTCTDWDSGTFTFSAPTNVVTASGRPDFVEYAPGRFVLFARTDNTPDYFEHWWLSDDYCRTWSAQGSVDSGETRRGEYAAPVVLAPGIVALVYSYETSSTDADLYERYYVSGYGFDLLGQAQVLALTVGGITIDPTGGAEGDVLTQIAGVFVPQAPTSSGGGIGPLLITDTPSTPLVFADLIQNEAQDDLVYADP